MAILHNKSKPRRLFERVLSAARRRLPFPWIWAFLMGLPVPYRSITGSMSGLLRPESVAFSKSGNHIVVGNSGGSSLTVYSKSSDSKDQFDSIPTCSIINGKWLNFVHDAIFTPCENYVIGVGRDCHSLAVFELSSADNVDQKEVEPVFHIWGDESRLSYPGGVAIHPSGNWLAVANRGRFGITLYRRKGTSFEFESVPFQSIPVEELVLHGLATPQGIDFSSDGESLIVTYKEFYLNEDPKGKSGISLFKCHSGGNPGIESEPAHVYHFGDRALHSVAFHPKDPFMAVTDENGSVEVHRLPSKHEPMRKMASIATLVGEEGPKGVGFSADGKLLGACTVFNEVLLYKSDSIFKLSA